MFCIAERDIISTVREFPACGHVELLRTMLRCSCEDDLMQHGARIPALLLTRSYLIYSRGLLYNGNFVEIQISRISREMDISTHLRVMF